MLETFEKFAGKTCKLEKLKLKTSSEVKEGSKCIGEMEIFDYTLSNGKMGFDIIVGNNILNFIKTSTVKKVLKKTLRSVTFNTLTSTYKLTLVSKKKDK